MEQARKKSCIFIQENCALQARLGEIDKPKYIISDYNAWCQVMCMDQKPRRLLCPWHVIKKWNIQVRSNIKNPEVRQSMEKEMRKILKETDHEKLMELKDSYLVHLKKKEEIIFLNYICRELRND